MQTARENTTDVTPLPRLHNVNLGTIADFVHCIPYRGKLRRGKVTKFSSSDENFPRRKFSPVKIFPDETFAPTNIPNEYFTR